MIRRKPAAHALVLAGPHAKSAPMIAAMAGDGFPLDVVESVAAFHAAWADAPAVFVDEDYLDMAAAAKVKSRSRGNVYVLSAPEPKSLRSRTAISYGPESSWASTHNATTIRSATELDLKLGESVERFPLGALIVNIGYEDGLGASTYLANAAAELTRTSDRATLIDLTADQGSTRVLGAKASHLTRWDSPTPDEGPMAYFPGVEVNESSDGVRYVGAGRGKANPVQLQAVLDTERMVRDVVLVDLHRGDLNSPMAQQLLTQATLVTVMVPTRREQPRYVDRLIREIQVHTPPMAVIRSRVAHGPNPLSLKEAFAQFREPDAEFGLPEFGPIWYGRGFEVDEQPVASRKDQNLFSAFADDFRAGIKESMSGGRAGDGQYRANVRKIVRQVMDHVREHDPDFAEDDPTIIQRLGFGSTRQERGKSGHSPGGDISSFLD